MKQKSSSLNSVEKALCILLAFTEERPVWGVRQLSAALKLSPATVQRLLQNLKEYGFVVQEEHTRQYRLGHVYFRFLNALQSRYPITRQALPPMQDLMSLTQETVHLNVIDGEERICIEHVESAQQLKAGMPLGHRSPLYAGASSKCLLAFSPPEFIHNYLQQVNLVALTENTLTDPSALRDEIERIRRRGYASSLGERTPGLGSLSAPVLGHHGLVLAALSLAIPEIRYRNRDHRITCLDRLRQTAAQLSQAMGYGHPGPDPMRPPTQRSGHHEPRQ